MQLALSLYKALKSINIEESQVSAVIDAMETHIENRTSQAVAPLLAKIAELQTVLGTKIDTLGQSKTDAEKAREQRTQLIRWVIGTGVAVASATVGILKALGYLH